jgi:hypothetical protein
MKKKVLIIALALLAVTAASSFAIGIGGSFALPGLGLPGTDVMLSAKLDQLPFLMGIGFTIGQNTFQLGFTADWWLFTENLVSFINLYAGPGLYVGISEAIQLGARVPIGLNAYPLDILELFLEIAPTISATFGDPISFPNFDWQGSFGFRFWFN